MPPDSEGCSLRQVSSSLRSRFVADDDDDAPEPEPEDGFDRGAILVMAWRMASTEGVR